MKYSIALLGVLACSSPPGKLPIHESDAHVSQRDCGITNASRLDGEGIGDIQIGQVMTGIRRTCTVISDSEGLGDEALPERRVVVATAHGPISFTVVSDRVWRLVIRSPSFQTRDGLGVGVQLTALLRHPNLAGIEGEGKLFALSPDHCGLSFGIRYEIKDHGHMAHWSHGDLTKLPPDSEVDEILVFGCNTRSP